MADSFFFKKPRLLFFLLDQSDSMGEPMLTGKPRSTLIADLVNRKIAQLVPSFKQGLVGGLGYGGKSVTNLFPFPENVSFAPVSTFATLNFRIEKRIRKERGSLGEAKAQPMDFPIWLDPAASGKRPMCLAFFQTAKILRDFMRTNPQSTPPTILHVTSGPPEDGNPEELGKIIMALRTDKGAASLFNVHLGNQNQQICLPRMENELPGDWGKMLFRISSPFSMDGLKKSPDPYGRLCAGLMFGIKEYEKVVDFFDLCLLNYCS